MTTTKKIMQKELRSICHYLSFLCTRIFMCALLFLFGYTLRPSSYYMIFSIIMFPVMWHIMLTSSQSKPNSRQSSLSGRSRTDSPQHFRLHASAHPRGAFLSNRRSFLSDKKREGSSDVLLSSLKSRYHYTPQKLKAEILGFLCICLLLLFWQNVKNHNAAALTPLDHLPLYTIAGSLFVRICAFYIIKSILHNRLMNNRL